MRRLLRRCAARNDRLWIMQGIVLHGICLAWCTSVLAQPGPPATVEWEVSAECLPHADINGPTQLSVRFVHLNTQLGVEAQAFLAVADGPEIAATATRWDYPERQLFSALFAGPEVVNHRYCQNTSEPAGFQLSYYRQPGVKLYTNTSADLSSHEVATVDGANTPLLHVQPEGTYRNIYRVGRDTANPYWLQFAIPLHAEPHITTNLRYEFP